MPALAVRASQCSPRGWRDVTQPCDALFADGLLLLAACSLDRILANVNHLTDALALVPPYPPPTPCPALTYAMSGTDLRHV
eukprot:2397089-Rhodomonas_salina.1